MLAVSPQLSGLGGWLLDDDIMINHDQEIINNNCNSLSFGNKRTSTSDSTGFHHSPNCSGTQFLAQTGEFSSFHDQEGIFADQPGDDCGNKIVQKLNHNASERDRRKRMNTMYSTLRSVLPADDHSRKLSIPATVSRATRYIPELQKEVERLIQKKEALMLSNNIPMQEQQETSSSSSSSSLSSLSSKNSPTGESSSAISIARISDLEMAVQISVSRAEKGPLSEVVMNLEEEGFLVLNASSFESFDGRNFCNLHLLQAQGDQVIDAEKLKVKIWSFCEKREENRLY